MFQRQHAKGWEEKSHGAPVTPESPPLIRIHSYTSAALEPQFGMLLGITEIFTTFQSPRLGAGAVPVALCQRCSVLTADCHANLAHMAPELHHVNKLGTSEEHSTSSTGLWCG